MQTPNHVRQRKWKQKQVSKGMRAVTVMLPAEIKELIDNKRRETGTTIAHIIEIAVLNLLTPPEDTVTGRLNHKSGHAIKELSMHKMQQIRDDLNAITNRIEQIAGLTAPVTSNTKNVTIDVCAPRQPDNPAAKEIYRLVRLLNNMEVSPDEIAFTLNKRKFKTLSGANEWKVGDVLEVLKDIHEKYGHINPLFSISDNP